MRYDEMTDAQRLAWAGRFRDPARRAKAEAKVLEDIAARDPGRGTGAHPKRRRRPAGGGTVRRGS